jgi:hypothetical protein
MAPLTRIAVVQPLDMRRGWGVAEMHEGMRQRADV